MVSLTVLNETKKTEEEILMPLSMCIMDHCISKECADVRANCNANETEVIDKHMKEAKASCAKGGKDVQDLFNEFKDDFDKEPTAEEAKEKADAILIMVKAKEDAAKEEVAAAEKELANAKTEEEKKAAQEKVDAAKAVLVKAAEAVADAKKAVDAAGEKPDDAKETYSGSSTAKPVAVAGLTMLVAFLA